MSRAHVPALQAPLSTSRSWRKRKCATTTDDDGCRRWQAYSSLAKIIPDMPIGYKNNNGSKPTSTRAQRLRSRAEECRTLADCFTSPACRKQLTELAQSYERMAVAVE
jgi:hypothetical protein